MIGYLVINSPWHWEDPDQPGKHRASAYRLRGYPHPTVFKTLRNAIRAAGPHGHVLILDLHRLPRVYYEQIPLTRGETKELTRQRKRGESKLYAQAISSDDLDINDMNAEDIYVEHQLAERQAIIWAERLGRLETRLKR